MDVERANIEQRVFDAFPPFPEFITIFSLFAKFPHLESESVEKAVRRLVTAGKIDIDKRSRRHLYRLRKGAQRPIDMRGHHGRSGRKRRAN